MAKYYYKTDVPCDGVEITFFQGDAQTGPSASGAGVTTPTYVIGADNIQVFAEMGSPAVWTLLTEDNYSEVTTTTINTINVDVTSMVKVIRKPGRLVEGTHYTRINSQIIEFTNDPSSYNITKIYTVNPAKSKLNPGKIIDTDAGVVITDVPVWDPARGHHFHNAIHAVDIQNNVDPAEYNIIINTGNALSEQPWDIGKVGIKWFDTSTIGYLPYYDDKVFPDINDRIFYWGDLAPWASVDFYEWTKSDVIPEEYDAIASVQEGDITIPEEERVTGIAKPTPYTRTRNAFPFTVTIGSQVTSIGHTFGGSPAATVIISTDDTLPTPLEPGEYTVANVVGDTFQLLDTDGNPVLFLDVGTGIQTMADATWTTVWDKETSVHEVFDVVLEGIELTNGPIFTNNFIANNIVEVYINEAFIESLTVGLIGSPGVLGVTLTSYVLQPQDTIRIIKQAHDIVADDEAFDPDVTDDGTVHTQYKNFYDYTEVTTIGDNGFDEVKTYFFWVGEKSVRTIPNSALSLREASEQLEEIPIPYIIFQNLKIQEVTTDTLTRLPARYNQIVLRGHAGLINADNRYVLRFTRDLTLRDKLENRENEPMLKNVHTEWEIFREKQTYHPLRTLWDSITESIVGYHLADPTTQIPARERVLYDDTYGTDTQYGLGDGQIFVDGDIALATVLADLNSPYNDFYPTDIDVFFQQYSFDTNENVILAMDRIYNTFSYEHVNRILHSVILDAFSKKAKYPDIFKTSMVSLHGIRILETAGLYDD